MTQTNTVKKQDLQDILHQAIEFQKAGNFKDAILCYQEAMKTAPDDPSVYNEFGMALLRIGKNDLAIKMLQTATELDPGSSTAFRNLGLAEFAVDHRDAAISALQKAIDLDDSNVDALINLGQIHCFNDSFDRARLLLEKAHELEPDNPEPVTELAEVFVKLGQYGDAIQTAKKALGIRDNSIKALRALSQAYRLNSNHSNALRYADLLVQASPDEIINRIELAKALLSNNRIDEAKSQLDEAQRVDPERSDIYTTRAQILSRTGQWNEALEILDQAIALAPEQEEIIAQKAGVLHRLNRNEEAYNLLLPLVDQRRSFKASSLQVFSKVSLRYNKEKEAIRLLESVLANPGLARGVRSELSFSAGELQEKAQNFKKAFKHFESGNKHRNIKYNYNQDLSRLKRLKKYFTKEAMNNYPQASIKTNRPIFIIGMPRSGTSLTEKILASHSQVFGANELLEIQNISNELHKLTDTAKKTFPESIAGLTQAAIDQSAQKYLDYIDGLDPDSHQHIVDKMPQNFMFLGMILLMFPDAPIIHCKRDPMDTCLSCFTQNFAAATGGMSFAFNLESLGQYYRIYENVMDFWEEQFPGRIHHLQYEALVTNPRPDVEKLLRYCNLEWEEACMEHDKSAHLTVTASYDQVRQPINTRSVEKWRQYEKQLAPLKESLEKYRLTD